ncbi:MAG: nucleotidyltransferase domain-containing protein [Azonexus sp.]|nr:nucleotidyltransferase domain-containing protein [Betaproteobacteria bacterium]MBK8917598.1 nucleotidyltransferase domain-containing protein [Betaproteobacteria bacterium]MBP6037368.1 nucleotidyltransferase domain-containing protein [Azonexus sp.]MBP6907995.1 nucleotidyltransferase domain-containing protein [Azonexus sp.]
MHPAVASKEAQIVELCRAHHVLWLDLFGSATGDGFDPKSSDADFLVEFDDSPEANSFADYFDLKYGLESLLGRPVDLVMPSAVRNPVLLAAIARQRIPLYGA